MHRPHDAEGKNNVPKSTTSSLRVVGHTQSSKNTTWVRVWPGIPPKMVRISLLGFTTHGKCQLLLLHLLCGQIFLSCPNGHNDLPPPTSACIGKMGKLWPFYLLERCWKKRKKCWLKTTRLWICRQNCAISWALLLKTVRTE